ncbi:MAG: hypothetical protein HY356_07635 [Gammaproteobacteria bacterium]|nr:hypothetical protein [Gammaproteobacteria bacterium]
MTDVTDLKSYLAPFEGKEQDALKDAIETRKLEVDLYWRRASYFWTLSTVAFTGFFALQNSDKAPKASLVIISCIGFLFSLAWLLASRGAKHWQANWEAQVEMLEDQIIGPLFKTSIKPEGSIWNPFSSYPFSVTKINQLLSFFLTIIWVVLIVQSFYGAGLGFEGTFTYAGAVLVFTIIFAVLMFWLGRSSLKTERTVKMTRRAYK